MTENDKQSLSMRDYYKQNRELIEDICAGCCPPGQYCTLKEILIRIPRDTRTMVQIKCIEKLKYERSKALRRDIGWDEAHKIWIGEGHAERFARIYRKGIRMMDLYSAIMAGGANTDTLGENGNSE